jgi:hydrogenase small subunit
MGTLTRRDFLKIAGALAGAAGLSSPGAQVFAKGLENIYGGKTRILWLEGMSCTGCSVSLLNSENPKPLELLTQYISLVFHGAVGAAQGQTAVETIERALAAGDCIPVIEGAIPLGMPRAQLFHGKPFAETLLPVLEKAPFVVAAGTCSSFGGVCSAEGNPTGAVSVKQFMEHHGLPTHKRLICCPSCPTHPASLIGTLAHLSTVGYPEVDRELLTPVMFYGTSTHDNCPRFHDYNKHIFAQELGDQKGCLFELGCLGPLTYTKCPERQWNGGVNWCVRASAPCVGCSSPEFAQRRDFPFYRNREGLQFAGKGGSGHGGDES